MNGDLKPSAELPKQSMLIVGQIPPPWHGQAVATQMLFDHDWPGIDIECLRMAYSEEMDAVGRFSFGKVFHLWDLIRATRKILRARPGTILFYPPASAKWVPFLRDVAYLMLTRRLAGATVFIFHASGLAEFCNGSRLRRWLSRLAYGDAEVAFEVALEAIRPSEAFGSVRAVWSPCAADVPRVDRLNPAPERALRVLFVGSLQEGKGVLEVLKTASALKKAGSGDRFRFRIVGRWFSEQFRREAEGMRRDLEVENEVEFAGELIGSLKWEAYAHADLFFFPSHYVSEATPIVLMEALGSGLPVVSTDWRGIPAMTEGCEAATLLPVRRPDLYASAFEEFDRRRKDYISLSASARDHYERMFLPGHFLGRIERTLGEIRQGGSAARRVPGDAPKVIQVFNRYLAPGGEEVWVDELPGLARGAVDCRTIYFESRAWKTSGAPARTSQVRLMWNNPSSRARLRAEHRSKPCDALIFHNLIPAASFGMYEEASRLRLPVLQYAHNFRPFSVSGTMWLEGQVVPEALAGNRWPEIRAGAWERSRVKTALLAYYFARFAKSGAQGRVNRWIAVSEFMRERMVEAGLPPERVVALRHCWRARETLPPALDEGYYLFLGRLVAEKGVATLIESWNRLREQLGDKCPHLVIAGDGPQERALKVWAKANPLVSFSGYVSGERKTRLILGCRAVVAPSLWWEPLGLIVYEAYDQGKPVLAARSGGLVETVEGGRGGFLHDPGDAQDLAASVVQLEGLGRLGRQQLGMQGREWLLDEADPGKWRTIFRQLVADCIQEGPIG